MNNEKINNFLKDPRTNWKYILIVVILAFLVGGGILGYWHLWLSSQEKIISFPEISKPEIPKKEAEKKPKEEIPQKEKLFVVESNPSSADDIAESITIDLNYIYIVGTDRVLGDSNWRWRIEKKDKITSALVYEFGEGGVVTSVKGVPRSIDADSNYIYIAGYDFSQKGLKEWRVEKRDKINGMLVNEFGMAGVITYSTQIYDESADLIIVDSNYIYVIGYEFFDWDDYQWRIEKRDKKTGKLVIEFGTNGAVIDNPGPFGDYIKDIVIDSNNIYLIIQETSPTDPIYSIEKRNKSNGDLINEFGKNGKIIISNSPNKKLISSIAVDDNYIYLVGGDGNSPNSDLQWRIEKRDKKTGNLIEGFGEKGIINSNPSADDEYADSVAEDSDYLYIIGMDSTAPYIGINSRWRIEKRRKTTGSLIHEFGEKGVIICKGTEGGTTPLIKINSNYIYISGSVVFNDFRWRVEKREKTTGNLVPF